jgi:hypothetical protein
MSSGSDYGGSMPKRLDRLLVLAAAALLVAIFFDAAKRLSPGGGSTSEVPAATVPQLIRLVPSSTAFLANCPAQDLHLAVGPGRTLTLRFAGGRCHVPPLHLRETVRDPHGAVVYRGPALANEALSGNYAISGSAQGALLGPCGSVLVSGSGLRASGRIRCSSP